MMSRSFLHMSIVVDPVFSRGFFSGTFILAERRTPDSAYAIVIT